MFSYTLTICLFQVSKLDDFIMYKSYCDFIACQASRNIHEKDRRRFFPPGTSGYILGCMIDIWAWAGMRGWWWPRDLLLRVCSRCSDRWAGTICTLCPDLSLDQRDGWLRFDTACSMQITDFISPTDWGLEFGPKGKEKFLRAPPLLQQVISNFSLDKYSLSVHWVSATVLSEGDPVR